MINKNARLRSARRIIQSVLLVIAATALFAANTQHAAAQSPNGITSPAAGALVRASFTVVAVADDASFRKWQLDLLLWGDPSQALFLGVGDAAQPTPASLQTVDSALFPDGEHLLRLRVVRADQNYDEYFTPILIGNHGRPTARPAGGLGGINVVSRVTQLVTVPLLAAPPPAATPLPTATPLPAATAVAEIAPTATVAAAPLAVGALLGVAQLAGATAAPKSTATPIYSPAAGEKWIEVNLSDQTLTAWQENKIVMHTSVSTGKPGWRTLPGTFAVYLKYDVAHMVGDVVGDEYDTPDVPWTMYYSGSFAIHGAYWHNDFGSPVSHGCVNMRVDEAKTLYDWSPMGIKVIVHA